MERLVSSRKLAIGLQDAKRHSKHLCSRPAGDQCFVYFVCAMTQNSATGANHALRKHVKVVRVRGIVGRHPMAILSHLAVMLAAAACRPGPRLRWQRSANSGPQRRGAWLDSSDDIRLSGQSIWRPPMVPNRISRRGTLVAEASEPREQRAMTSTPITNQAHPASLSVRKMLSDQRAPVRARPAKPWPAFIIGFGLAASVAWTATLGWLVVKAVRLIL